MDRWISLKRIIYLRFLGRIISCLKPSFTKEPLAGFGPPLLTRKPAMAPSVGAGVLIPSKRTEPHTGCMLAKFQKNCRSTIYVEFAIASIPCIWMRLLAQKTSGAVSGKRLANSMPLRRIAQGVMNIPQRTLTTFPGFRAADNADNVSANGIARITSLKKWPDALLRGCV